MHNTIENSVPELVALRTNAVLFVMSLGRAMGVVC